jgi:soluble lytic murein transglycosylase-like protein
MGTTNKYDDYFKLAEQRYPSRATHWMMLKAQAMQESALNPSAQGPPTRYGRAKGLAQFIDATWLEEGVDADGDGRADPFNARDAIYAQAKYMAKILDYLCRKCKIINYVPGWAEALAGYNWGMGNTWRHIKANGLLVHREINHVSPGFLVRRPLPAETEEYITRIMHNLKELLEAGNEAAKLR